MPSVPAPVRRAVVVTTLVLAASVATTVDLSPASAQGSTTITAHSVEVRRGGPDAKVTFHRGHAGEVFLDVNVSARGVNWSERRNTAAVVSAYVDGHYATDIVIMSSSPASREFALGRLHAGRHTLRLHYATGRSNSQAGRASLQAMTFKTVRASSPAYAAARYAPVLYGRDIPSLGGRFENNHTDTPLVAWHQVLPATKPGHHLIEYSVMWSNEDGGTDTRALMAQWGRTTDIEWVYRVEVDAKGRRVPGTGVFQAAGHATQKFHGKYDGTHPLIQTCTSNNNVCDKVTDPMRFALSARPVLPVNQPREHEMDIHPWTYQVMAREVVREHKTAEIGDPRDYLYVAVDHQATPASAASAIGLAVEVKLKGDPTTYASNDGLTGLTILRNGPAATTVRLPGGTTPSDIASISVRRVAFGADDGTTTLTVTALERAFFLRHSYLPKASFAHVRGSDILLTQGSPVQPIWTAS